MPGLSLAALAAVALAACGHPLPDGPAAADSEGTGDTDPPQADGDGRDDGDGDGDGAPGVDSGGDSDDGGTEASDDEDGDSYGTSGGSSGDDAVASGGSGLDDVGDDGSSDGDGTESTGSPPSCEGEGGACVEIVPLGWQGPVALIETLADDPAPDCIGSYPLPVAIAAFSGFAAPSAECECACGDVQAECVGSMQVSAHDPPPSWPAFPCQYPAEDTWTLDENDLSAVVSGVDVYWRLMGTPLTYEAACEPEASSEIVPAGFETRLTLCAADPIDGPCAEGEGCFPEPEAPADAAVCIWQDGDVPCPDGSYGERTVFHQGIDDTRACTDCECDGNEGSCGVPLATVSLAPLFSGNSIATPVGGCVLGSGSAYQAVLDPGDPIDPSCEASGGEPIGTAEAIDPITVCCAS